MKLAARARRYHPGIRNVSMDGNCIWIVVIIIRKDLKRASRLYVIMNCSCACGEYVKWMALALALEQMIWIALCIMWCHFHGFANRKYINMHCSCSCACADDVHEFASELLRWSWNAWVHHEIACDLLRLLWNCIDVHWFCRVWMNFDGLMDLKMIKHPTGKTDKTNKND